MNKIEVSNNNITSNSLSIKNNEIILTDDDVMITYINTNKNFNFFISGNVRLFEYYKNSCINNKYILDENSNLNINRFVLDCSIESDVDLNFNSNLNYKYSCLNFNDNNYVININHKSSNTTSNVNNFGLNFTNSKLDFLINGKVFKDSTNTKMSQNSKIILMKDNNSMIKPNLIIANNLVDASHSAYLGHFKEDELFYLTSRGISIDEGKKLLAKAYLVSNMDIDFSCKNLILNDFNNNWRC